MAISRSFASQIEASSQSIWREGARRSAYPALDASISADVCVVGGGITGLTAALLLLREGRRVALLEAEGIGAGATGATSAHVTHVPDMRYGALIDLLGVEDARVLAAEARAAFKTMQALAVASPVHCEWRAVPAYLYGECAGDAERLEREAEAARELGVGAILTDSVPLLFPVRAAILFPGQARFHPLRYLEGLARLFIAGGGNVFERTRVRDWTERGGLVRVEAERGRVEAGAAILATHDRVGLSPLQPDVVPYDSYVVALRVRDRVPDALYWDTATPYHYLRRCQGGAGEVLLVGGEDRRSDHESDPKEGYRRLVAYARARFSVTEVVQSWSARYFETADGLPYVGRSALGDNVFVATGYSGSGLVFGSLAAGVLRELIVGRETRLSRILEARR